MQRATFKQGPFEFTMLSSEGFVAYSEEDRGYKTPCFVWQRCLGRRGYGLYNDLGRMKLIPAHRFAYKVVYGEIPPGLVIDHQCRVTGCVNPDHLEAVTQAVNVQRSIATKLSERKATEIRRLYRETSASFDALAAQFRVSAGAIRKVIEGETWQGIDAYNRGEVSKRTKIPDSKLSELRELWATGGYTQAELAKLFGVCRSRVSVLVRNKAR